MAKSRELTVACMCGASTHTFSVCTSLLPLPTYLCSCDISRRTSGSLLTSYINITYGSNPGKPDLRSVTAYQSSDILTRYFCTTCGTQMYVEKATRSLITQKTFIVLLFLHLSQRKRLIRKSFCRYLSYNSDGHFEAATGTLQVANTDGLVNFKAHMWIDDTLDGGASQYITDINGAILNRYLRQSDKSNEIPLDWKSPALSQKLSGSDKVYAHCHCKGVEFYVRHPNQASTLASSDWPDLIIPDETGRSTNLGNHSWWLPTAERFLAGTCACRSCTRASGFDITFWAFVPIANITLDADGTQPFTRNPYWGTIKTYKSRDDVKRSFCGTCGASVFYDADSRPTLVDVAVGLLDAKSGARAEDLLAWWPHRVSFSEHALNKDLIDGLEKGIKAWGNRNLGEGFIVKKNTWR